MTPLKAGTLEVDDEPDLKARTAQVVQHASDLEVTDAFNGLGVDDDPVQNDQIGNILTYLDGSIEDRESWLLLKGYALGLHFHAKSILVDLLMEAMAQCIHSTHRITDDRSCDLLVI